MGSVINAGIRTAYRSAHCLLRSYWFFRRPETNGSLCALWHDGKVLLIQNSYRRFRSLPGGYVRSGEDPRVASARELREELGIELRPEQLSHAYHGTHPFEFRQDTLDIYEAQLDEAPLPTPDQREVVWAGWVSPEEARRMNIVPHLREYLSGR